MSRVSKILNEGKVMADVKSVRALIAKTFEVDTKEINKMLELLTSQEAMDLRRTTAVLQRVYAKLGL